FVTNKINLTKPTHRVGFLLPIIHPFSVDTIHLVNLFIPLDKIYYFFSEADLNKVGFFSA
ncbi:hypothetical protein ACVETY_19600, partial [Acinetobacter baumannii]